MCGGNASRVGFERYIFRISAIFGGICRYPKTLRDNKRIVVPRNRPRLLFTFSEIAGHFPVLSMIWGQNFTVQTASINDLWMKSAIFWDITPCSPLEVNRRFGGTYRLHFQVRKISRARNQSESRWKAEASIVNKVLCGYMLSTLLVPEQFFKKLVPVTSKSTLNELSNLSDNAFFSHLHCNNSLSNMCPSLPGPSKWYLSVCLYLKSFSHPVKMTSNTEPHETGTLSFTIKAGTTPASETPYA
jgi:hypothetical protein